MNQLNVRSIQQFRQSLSPRYTDYSEVVKSTRRKGNMPTCPEKMETTEDVHIAANSEIGDHCLMYALSDSIHPQIAHPSQHQHNLVCVSCEQLKDATLSIQKLVECCTNIVRENEKLNDMNFKIKQSIQSINNCKNQDIKAKSKLFETMGQDEDIETTMKNVKHRVSVVEYNPSKKTAFKAIPAIGSYSNFQFEEQDICVWKACGVGPEGDKRVGGGDLNIKALKMARCAFWEYPYFQTPVPEEGYISLYNGSAALLYRCVYNEYFGIETDSEIEESVSNLSPGCLCEICNVVHGSINCVKGDTIYSPDIFGSMDSFSSSVDIEYTDDEDIRQNLIDTGHIQIVDIMESDSSSHSLSVRLSEKGKPYDENIRKVYYEFLGGNIGLQHIQPIIRTVLSLVNYEINELPSVSTASKMMHELDSVSRHHMTSYRE
ncbi:Hypothetical predicted protein [Mytilus galloprovincialis]|uniref:Uncharacterized protein n=1 Tax=Mytilus galloprovincialis TaxID=29158 RepID=A0A8B6D7J8_MYTGA|nr:Hypothetical predicted protein [Mytilus galloprovincialis]